MKNKLVLVTAIIFSISVKAQLYVPNGQIEGSSVNNNVGIGTQTPVAKLSVQAGPNGYPTPLKAISIWGPNSPANANSAQDLSWDFAAAGSSAIRSYRGSNFDTYMQFLTNSDFGGNAPQIRMHISQNGNIGIGNTNPAVKLDVYGTISSYEPTALGATINSFQLISQRSGNVGENTIINRLWTYRDGSLNNWYASRLHDGISVDNSFQTPNIDTKTWWERDPLDNIQSWGNNAETYLTINKGNIGIGTQNPDTKLAVKGTIHSNEIKVDLNVPAPDYVFENDYQLKSLEEVENYITKNKHLPEIPSAKEFEKNGINVSEMNMALLKKIEELTLYVIEQNKRLDKVEKENIELKREINSSKK